MLNMERPMMDDEYETWQDEIHSVTSFADPNDQDSPLDPFISADEPLFGDAQVPEPASNDMSQHSTDVHFNNIRNLTERNLRSMSELDTTLHSDTSGIMSGNDGSLYSSDLLSPSTTSDWDRGSLNTTIPEDFVCLQALDVRHTYPFDPETMSLSPTEAPQSPVIAKLNVSGQSPSSTRPHGANMSPRTSSRQQRREEKPVICEFCYKGHSYQRDLNRHYVARHPDEAPGKGLVVSRKYCKYCLRTFGRGDNLLRHLTRKHGRTRTG